MQARGQGGSFWLRTISALHGCWGFRRGILQRRYTAKTTLPVLNVVAMTPSSQDGQASSSKTLSQPSSGVFALRWQYPDTLLCVFPLWLLPVSAIHPPSGTSTHVTKTLTHRSMKQEGTRQEEKACDVRRATWKAPPSTMCSKLCATFSGGKRSASRSPRSSRSRGCSTSRPCNAELWTCAARMAGPRARRPPKIWEVSRRKFATRPSARRAPQV